MKMKRPLIKCSRYIKIFFHGTNFKQQSNTDFIYRNIRKGPHHGSSFCFPWSYYGDQTQTSSHKWRTLTEWRHLASFNPDHALYSQRCEWVFNLFFKFILVYFSAISHEFETPVFLGPTQNLSSLVGPSVTSILRLLFQERRGFEAW